MTLRLNLHKILTGAFDGQPHGFLQPGDHCSTSLLAAVVSLPTLRAAPEPIGPLIVLLARRRPGSRSRRDAQTGLPHERPRPCLSTSRRLHGVVGDLHVEQAGDGDTKFPVHLGAEIYLRQRMSGPTTSFGGRFPTATRTTGDQFGLSPYCRRISFGDVPNLALKARQKLVLFR